MKIAFSTNQVHPRDRFDYWHNVARKSLVEHESQPECRTSFEAEIATGLLGSIELVLFRNSPMKARHTQRHVINSRSEDLFVCRQMSGKLFIEQDGRMAQLEAGDLMLLDPLLAYEASFVHRSRTLVLKVPRRELEARIGKTRDMVAHPIKPVRAEDKLSSSVSAMLPSLASKLSGASAEMIGNHALDLLAISLARKAGEARPRVSSAKALILSNIRAIVDARIADPDLDGQTVAAAVGVSVRHVNEILSEHGTSIGRLILARRLARCKHALEDLNQAHRSITEIAYGWGFSDLTHFGRRFKQAYGLLPSEAQRLASQPNRTGGPLGSERDAHLQARRGERPGPPS